MLTVTTIASHVAEGTELQGAVEANAGQAPRAQAPLLLPAWFS
jgi:hypothetical protein